MRQLLGSVAVALATTVATGALAQTTVVQPSGKPSHAQSGTTPETLAPNGSSTAGTGTLSDKLEKTDGVIKPPSNVDPGLVTPAPNTGTMPVIPPAGTPGSARPNVQPK